MRKESGLSHESLAKKIGYSRSIIGFWENGKKKPTAEALIALAKFFDVTVDYLLGLENNPETPYHPPLKKTKIPTITEPSEIQEIYDQLSPLNRGKLIGRAEALLEEQQNQDQQNKKLIN
ncbi:MAG: helix-turn-helix transcriptional regulator [Firmicutes bacterium]|nr:helix-turn-helix transcriptional regulator [Bacillota bacterium]